MEDLFKESVLIKYILNAQKENDDAEKRYTLLKELLAAKGEGYDKLKLPDEQIEGIINKYFPNSHINSGDYFSLLKKQQKENP